MIANDCLIGSIKNYGWREIKTFVISVERSGYDGDKVMFGENVQQDAIEQLQLRGWEFIPVVFDQLQNYGTARHIPVLDYLRSHYYRFVIYCDTRDLVLQSNPAVWLEEHLAPHELIGASECLRIRDEATNQSWIMGGLGASILNSLMDEDILCAGTIVGAGIAVTELLLAICQLSREMSGWGYDQAYVNYLLRQPLFKQITRVAKMSEGFIATCSWFLSGPERFVGKYTDDAPIFDTQTSTIRAPGSLNAFPILHQYDRGQGWEWLIAEKYK